MAVRILVTGATGFVGGRLCELLTERGYRVRAALRAAGGQVRAAAESVVVGDIGRVTDWSAALDGVERVIHCAARAHVLGDLDRQGQLYLEANAHGTESLANACVKAGVRRLIYLSSIKVNGEQTPLKPFTSEDVPHPTDPYGLSKWMGETRLMQIASGSTLEAAIVRSPLVYGPNVRANFLRLMRWIDSGVPLPFGRVQNTRSLVSVWNLCDLLERLARDQVPRLCTYLVSDGTDLSTPDLVREIAKAMRRRARLLPIPVAVLRAGCALAGRAAEFDRLCGTLTVDISATCRELGWRPPMSVQEGLARTVEWYLSERPAFPR